METQAMESYIVDMKSHISSIDENLKSLNKRIQNLEIEFKKVRDKRTDLVDKIIFCLLSGVIGLLLSKYLGG